MASGRPQVSFTQSTTSLGRSFFGRKHATASVLTLENVKLVMQETLKEALEELAIQVKYNVREELQNYGGEARYHSTNSPSGVAEGTDEWCTSAAEDDEEGDSDFVFKNRHIRMNRFLPELNDLTRSHVISREGASPRLSFSTEPTDNGQFAGTLQPQRSPREYVPKHVSYTALHADDTSEFSEFLQEGEDSFESYIQKGFKVPWPRKSIQVMNEAGDWLRPYVANAHFEQATGFMVLLNALMLGVETDYRASKGDSNQVLAFLSVSEVLFCIVFTLELMLRLITYGWQFFVNRNWAWNVFDCVVVVFQVVEQVVRLLSHTHSRLYGENTSIMRTLRVLRFVRITRLVRLVRLVEELHTIMSSIVASMMALFWTLLLLVMIIYISSVFFTQVVLDLHKTKYTEKIHYYYGRLPRAILTMFEVIVSGVSWDEVVEPLMQDVSPMMGVIFCMYIAFCVFAMMNMATGVFVDRAIRKAAEDKDTHTANHISRLFFDEKEHDDEKVEINVHTFVKKIDTPDMQEYFKAINVDPSEARGLFKLLDADDSGTVDAEELVNGCLRLRGQAKALELSLIRHDNTQMFKALSKSVDKLNRKLRSINRSVADISLEGGGRRSGSERRPLQASMIESSAGLGFDDARPSQISSMSHDSYSRRWQIEQVASGGSLKAIAEKRIST